MIKQNAESDKIKRVTKKSTRTLDTPGQLKILQKQLVQLEKMASLGQLTAGIAHEIRNPLNLMISFAVISIDRVKELENEFQVEKNALSQEKTKIIDGLLHEMDQNLKKVKEHGNRIDAIVKCMLLHSRGKDGEFQSVDLNRMLEENLGLVKHSLHALEPAIYVDIETNFDQTIEKVNIVPQDFCRAFLNIVNNACFAANEKQKKDAPEYSPLVSIKSRNLGNRIEVSIRDNGSGIPEKYRDKIFTPFFTTKPAGTGTGLGLSIAYDIITDVHKGAINFESIEGEYAEFIITIPS